MTSIRDDQAKMHRELSSDKDPIVPSTPGPEDQKPDSCDRFAQAIPSFVHSRLETDEVYVSVCMCLGVCVCLLGVYVYVYVCQEAQPFVHQSKPICMYICMCLGVCVCVCVRLLGMYMYVCQEAQPFVH